MVILGIDPGFGRVGYGIIEYKNNKYRVIEYGSITTPFNSDFSKRLLKIAEDLEDILERNKIDQVAIEELFFNTNVTTGINVAQARGVMLYIFAKHNIEVFGYTPMQAKIALCGYGKADKLQMKEMVKSFLKLKTMPKLDDTTDALALAITHIHSHKFTFVKDSNKITKANLDLQKQLELVKKQEKKDKEKLNKMIAKASKKN